MLLNTLRKRAAARLAGDESGFTLIELLVVMLIIGILAAIALPSFFNQKDKANDAKAKETAHTSQVAMETCATDNNGQYTLCNLAALRIIEPTIPASGVTVSNLSGTTYTITVDSATTGQSFTVTNNAGALTYPCTMATKGGCPSTGVWGG